MNAMARICVTFIGLLTVLTLALCVRSASTTAPSDEREKRDVSNEQIVRATLGDVLLYEDGIIVSAKRENDGKLKSIYLIDETSDSTVLFTRVGPFGKPSVRYDGTSVPKSISRQVWSDFNSDGTFDMKLSIEEDYKKSRVEILVDGKWIAATKTGADETSPFKTDIGIFTFDVEKGSWQRKE